MRLPAIEVAASIVEDSAGRVLVAERTPRQLSAGFWELPGGKMEPGETPEQAAARELLEETGLTATSLRPWVSYTHDFPTRRLRLHFFRATGWRGTARGHEGQRLAWVTPSAPEVGPLLASNRRVMLGLGLPKFLAVSGGEGEADSAMALAQARSALAFGAKLILVSHKNLPPDQRISLARRISELASATGADIVIEGSALEARRACVAGAVASARELRRTTVRPPLSIWGARCRDAADLAHAVALGADFVLVAPVLASLDGTRPIGWAAFAALAELAPLPVFAQGGLLPSMLREATGHGAAGLAVRLADLTAAGTRAA